jgi:hypothetical protein
MEKKKIKLEDLKIESFLTEIDESKVVRIQGGGQYDTDTKGDEDDTKLDPDETVNADCPSFNPEDCFDTEKAINCFTLPDDTQFGDHTCDGALCVLATWP